MAVFTLSLKLIDGYNRKSTRNIDVQAVDFATAKPLAESIVTAYDGISQMGVTRWTLSEETIVSGVPDPTANKDAGVTLSWDLGAFKLGTIKVPSPEPSIFDANGNVILTDAAVTAFETAILAAALISDGETPLDLVKGVLDK